MSDSHATMPSPNALGVDDSVPFLVIVSADAEWRAVAELFPSSTLERTPFGEYFYYSSGAWRGIVMHGGWGKVDAAASAQYGIARWRPSVIVNLGTCAGIVGQIERSETVLAERTLIYDITERMGDSAEAIRSYTTTIELAWLESQPLPSPVRRVLLVSADRDLAPRDVPMLRRLYGAVVVDWESGAIARVAQRNETRVVILRGVSDLVSEESDSDTYGRPDVFEQRVTAILQRLFDVLPKWLEVAVPSEGA
jgi:adenosylhomocysteine nucleosidase